MTADGHAGQPVIERGAPLETATAAVIMVHGRGASPDDILALVPHLSHADVAYLAPAAAHRSWYPYSFMADISSNEPWLTSALDVLGSLVGRVEAAGIPQSRIILLGFSQGACLSAEFAVRHGSRFGGIVVFSGGLIGPPGTAWALNGEFAGTPVFLGCSDVDAHIPRERVIESADAFRRMGAEVTARIYPGMGHVVNDDELAFARRMLDALGPS
jgi:predicted esterase